MPMQMTRKPITRVIICLAGASRPLNRTYNKYVRCTPKPVEMNFFTIVDTMEKNVTNERLVVILH
jgi:hypothetical protein